MNEKLAPKCHNTPMEYEAGESASGSDFSHDPEEWFVCKHCGCVKDENGKVIKQEKAK